MPENREQEFTCPHCGDTSDDLTFARVHASACRGIDQLNADAEAGRLRETESDVVATNGSVVPTGTALVSVPQMVERFGVLATLYAMHAAGMTGDDAIGQLRRAGVADIDIEAACLAIEQAP